MIVIAMTDEIGTGSKAVADAVASQLKLAHIAQANEMRTFGRRRERLKALFAGAGDALDGAHDDRHSECDDLRKDLAREILELAAHGNVLIRGQCVPAILADVGHVLRVRITAPPRFRVQNIVQSGQAQDVHTAEALMRNTDAAYAQLNAAFFGILPGDRGLWDVTLDAGRLSAKTCAEVLVRLARAPQFRPTSASKIMLTTLRAEAAARPGVQVARVAALDRSRGNATLISDDAISRAEAALYGAGEVLYRRRTDLKTDLTWSI